MEKYRNYLSTSVILIVGMLFISACGAKQDDKETVSKEGAQEVDLSQMGDIYKQPAQPSASNQNPEAVYVKVNGTPITHGEVQEKADQMLSQMQGIPAAQMQQIAPRARQKAAESLIMNTVIEDTLKNSEITISDDEITARIEEIKERLPPKANLEDLLAQQGKSDADLRKDIAKELKLKTLMESETEAVSEPSETEIKEYYTNNEDSFVKPESVTASHILIAFDKEDDKAAKKEKLEKIKELKVALDEGADFAKLASENSDCPSSEKGGKLGTFSKGQMAPAFEKAAFSQELGKVGDVVETSFGYHLIKVSDKTEAEKVPFEEAKEKIKISLKSRAQQKKVAEFLEGLKEQAEIEYPEQD